MTTPFKHSLGSLPGVLGVSLAICWLFTVFAVFTHQPLSLQLSLLLLLPLITGMIVRHQANAVPDKFSAAIDSMVMQLQAINKGRSERLALSDVPAPLLPLKKEIDIHLAMETDRLLQEQSFSSDASHELRTPLAGMRLQAQIAQRTPNETQREKALNNIIKAVDRSTRMVEQLLSYSRLSKRRAQAEQTQINMTEMCRQTIAKYASMISAKALQLEVRLDDDSDAILEGHYDQMATLFANGIQNAIEHTPEKGALLMSVTNTANAIIINVEDSGPGIAETDHNRVIVPFQRSSDGKQKGTGLGLAICQRVASLHAGDLTLGRSSLGGLSLQVTFLKPLNLPE